MFKFYKVCFLDRIMEREKNVMDSTHALTYWTTERLQKIDIAHFYSGKITKMREVIKSVDPHTTKVCTVLLLLLYLSQTNECETIHIFLILNRVKLV